jgi:hypothetical protein
MPVSFIYYKRLLEKAKRLARGGRKATGLGNLRQPGCRRIEEIFGSPVFCVIGDSYIWLLSGSVTTMFTFTIHTAVMYEGEYAGH